MNSYRVVDHISYVEEAYIYLYRRANNKNITGSLDGIKVDEDDKSIIKKHIIEINKYIDDNLKLNEERIEYFFKEREKNLCTLAAFSILWDYGRLYDCSIDEYGNRLSSMDEAKIIMEYAKICDEEAAQVYMANGGSFRELSDLVTFINDTDLDREIRFDVINIFYNRERYYVEVKDMINEVIRIIKRCEDKIDTIVDIFYKYWSDNADELCTILMDRHEFIREYSRNGIVVQPSIYNCTNSSLTLTLDETETDEPIYIHMGVLLDITLSIPNRRISADEVEQNASILADKTKLKILEFIARRPAYGKEIAKELNISTPTVSYHIKSMLETEFIIQRIDSGKVYYEPNRRIILKRLDAIKAYINNI